MNEDEAYEILLHTHNSYYDSIKPIPPKREDYPKKDITWEAAQTAYYLAEIEWRLEKAAREPKPFNYGKKDQS